MIKKLALTLAMLAICFPCKAEDFVIDPSNNAVSHNNAGLNHFNNGYYAAAVEEFKIAISLSPDVAATAPFYNNLGLVYTRIGRNDLAIPCFQRAINTNPNFMPYYTNFVKAHKANRTLSKINNKYVVEVSKDKDNSNAWLMLALINIEIGRNNEALKCLNRFKELEPDLSLTQDIKDIINKIE